MLDLTFSIILIFFNDTESSDTEEDEQHIESIQGSMKHIDESTR